MSACGASDLGPFLRGTRAAFLPGDLITRGSASDDGSRWQSRWVYSSASPDAATEV